jgi:hypothetical protein
VWISSRSTPRAVRNAEIWMCRFFSVTIRPGHTRATSASLLTTGSSLHRPWSGMRPGRPPGSSGQ